MSKTKSSKKYKPGFWLAVVAFCLAVAVVFLGTLTRLTDAGLGCPDWPGCYGSIMWPNEPEDISRAEESFQHTPVDVDKARRELVHRYLGGALGLVIFIIAWKSWLLMERRDYPFRLPIFTLFIVVWQSLFGMWAVTLKLWPLIVLVHISGGVALMALLWLLVCRLGVKHWRISAMEVAAYGRLRPLIVVGIVVIGVQIVLGGWTAANYAALSCTGFPTCNQQWLPALDWMGGFNFFQAIGPNYLGGQMDEEARAAIHFVHRLGALATVVYFAFFCARLMCLRDRRLNQFAAVIFMVLALEVGLGIVAVIWHRPLAIGLAHSAGAGLLMLVLTSLACRVWLVETVELNSD